MAAESERAFNGGPPEEAFFRETVLTSRESGIGATLVKDHAPGLLRSYPNHLDWFAVDLDGEHSAMDGTILEEHTEYVVQAIGKVCHCRFCARSPSSTFTVKIWWTHDHDTLLIISLVTDFGQVS